MIYSSDLVNIRISSLYEKILLYKILMDTCSMINEKSKGLDLYFYSKKGFWFWSRQLKSILAISPGWRDSRNKQFYFVVFKLLSKKGRGIP